MAHLDRRVNRRRFPIDVSIAVRVSLGAMVRLARVLRCLLVHLQIKNRPLYRGRGYHGSHSKLHVLAISKAVRFDSF